LKGVTVFAKDVEPKRPAASCYVTGSRFCVDRSARRRASFSTYSAGAAAAHSRMIVGWQLASDLRTDPVLEALKMAVVDATRAPASN